jgi:large subunit ribosomal protein L9
MANDKVFVKLLTRLAGIGKEGEIVSVSRSQARNFLIPKKFAVEASEKLIQDEEDKKKRKQDNRMLLVEQRHKIAEQLHGKSIAFTLRGSGDKVFGGIGEHEIIEKIKGQFDVELEKRHIILPEGHHIKSAGKTDIKVHLGEDTYVRMSVEISV